MLSSPTIRAWPRRFDPAERLPHPFRKGYEQLQISAQDQPCLLYSPHVHFGAYESTAKLLVWAGQRLACLDARHGGVVTTVLSLDQVYEVEWGQVLLEAWLRLVAHGPGGRVVIRVGLNAVGFHLYKPIADTARSAAYARTRLSLADARAKLSALLPVDHRFVGLGSQALLSGVELLRQWFQPRVAVAAARASGVRIPALLLLVTQAELIIVEEQAQRGFGGYGAVWRCLPLRSIRGVSLVREPARGVLSLRLSLPERSEVRVDVDEDSEGAVRAFLQEIDPRWAEPVTVLHPVPIAFDPFEEA